MKSTFVKILCALVLTGMLTSCSGKGAETTAENVGMIGNTAPETDKEETDAAVTTSAETEDAETVISYVTEAPAEYDDSWETVSMEDQILADDENWSVTGRPVYKDGYMGVDEPAMFDVAYLTPVGPEESYRFEFELKTSQTEKDDKWLTLFAGLRIESESGIADEQNGLWISFKNGVLGIKGATNGTWNEGVTELPLPFSFEDGFRRVCIEDDRVANEIKIYQADDKGANVLVYKLCIVNADGYSVINVFSSADNFENTAQSVVLDTDLSYYKNGYIKLWNHNRGGVYVKNLAIKII